MNIIITKNYDEMSKEAAKIVVEVVEKKGDAVLGLATGSTPVGTYKEMIKAHEAGLDFSNVKSFNLDEYVGLDAENDQSYRYFMKKNLFDHVNINIENTHFPDAGIDGTKNPSDYDDAIRDAGGVDLQILGIGQNGHIAFNEPAESIVFKTHVTGLTESTIKANSRFFNSIDEVPKTAVTSGLGTIHMARKIIILASGAEKHEAVSKLIEGKEISLSCPATMLLFHNDVTLICDEAAAYGKQK
ncbi:MAG: glucosamine-6-phosphate deaminase [Eubacterium sp.]|nr:glucosamine-6-phosphate deaminase [Eubacterium sp.]